MVRAELSKFRSLHGPAAVWGKILLGAIPVAGVFFVSDAPFSWGWQS